MFEALKKKLTSFLGLAEEKNKEKKKKKNKSKKEKKEAKKKTTKGKLKKPAKVSPKTKETPAKELIEKVKVEEPAVEEPLQTTEEEPEKEGFFSKLFKKFTSSKITEEQFDEIFQELEIILLENNVAIEVVEKIKADLSKSLIGAEAKKADIEKKIMNALKDSILSVLIEPADIIEQINNKKDSPFVILFFGINGSGKTTSIAKLAYKLKKSGISCILAAADTFRAASIEQIQTHGQSLGIEVISKEYGSDPAAVAFEAIKHAEKNNIKAVLIDTAGRMYTKQNLMREMEKIVRVSKPDLKIFVGESITGNDATEQAKTFNETAGIDGIILSKADVDEKAGTILSVSYVTKKPIYFLGVGQKYGDLQEFKKTSVLKHIGLE